MAPIAGNMTTSHHMKASERIQCKGGERCGKVMIGEIENPTKRPKTQLRHISWYTRMPTSPLFKIPFFVVTAQKTALHSYISARLENMLTLIKSVFS